MFKLLVAVVAVTGQVLLLESNATFPTKEACEARFEEIEPKLKAPGAFANQDGPVAIDTLQHECAGVEDKAPEGQERM